MHGRQESTERRSRRERPARRSDDDQSSIFRPPRWRDGPRSLVRSARAGRHPGRAAAGGRPGATGRSGRGRPGRADHPGRAGHPGRAAAGRRAGWTGRRPVTATIGRAAPPMASGPRTRARAIDRATALAALWLGALVVGTWPLVLAASGPDIPLIGVVAHVAGML